MLSFQIGQKVFLRYEQEWARVVSLDSDPFLEVEDHTGSSFLVDSDDVLTEEEYHFEMLEKPSKPATESLANEPEQKLGFDELSAGFYILLKPSDNQPISEEYQCWLLNTSVFMCSFHATLFTLDAEPFIEESILDNSAPFMFCEVYKEDIGSQARIDLNVEFEIPGSKKTKHSLRFKLQPKKILESPLRKGGDGSEYKIFQMLSLEQILPPESPKWTLASSASKKSKAQGNYFPLIDIQSKAAFSLDLDLHAEKIMHNHKSSSQKDIVERQMKVFEQYIQDALRHGIDRVFIIHGIGAGKLKERIHQRLDQMHFVSKFKNEFHPKYGWGATEVEF
jgi:hypothetical protein